MRSRVTVALAITLGVAACQGGAGVPQWCVTSGSGAAVRLVDGADNRQLHLTELWRVGGRDGDHVLAEPSRPSVSAQGRVAIPDMMTSSVIIVEPDGTWRGSILRKGDGPGEARLPVDAEWLAEDRLAVFDLAKGTVIEVSDDGKPLGDPWRINTGVYAKIAAAGSLPGEDLLADGSLILELPWEAVSGEVHEKTSRVVWLSPVGSVDTLGTQTVAVLGTPPFAGWAVPGEPVPLFAAGATGPVFIAGADGYYRIRVLTRAGRDSLLLCRAVPPRPYTSGERGGQADPPELQEALRAAPLPKVPSAIGGMFAGEGGRLWVVRDRPNAGSRYPFAEGAEYDVIGSNGAFLGTVHAPAKVFLFGEGGHQVYGFERGQYDELTLVAYSIAAGGGDSEH